MERFSSSDFKDYLKAIIKCPNWYVGKADENKEELICIYSNRRNLGKISELEHLQTYSILPITLLIKWGKNYKKAEEKANEIYELLKDNSFIFANFECFVKQVYEGPIELGSDKKNNFKFSLEINVIYKERND